MKQQPFMLTLRFRTPMVEPSVHKPLDAVLSWAAVQRAEFYDHADPRQVHHDLPLARHEVGDQWCFMASNLSCEWAGERNAISFIKRQKLSDYVDYWMKGLLKKKPAVDTRRGLYKAGLEIHPVREVEAVRAWGVGDIEELKKLMPWVTHVGKLHHHDHGAVASWEIVEDETAMSLWSQRPLPEGSPIACEDSHAIAIGGLQSPYWKRECHRQILVPIA